MITQKGGCFLINLETQKVALIYRERYNEYSFPKGHIEAGESIKDCAIRETIEETMHNIELIEEEPICINKYTTPSGENVECYMFLAKDLGDYTEFIDDKDKEVCMWFDVDKVNDILSYDNLKNTWSEALPIVKKYI